MRSMIGLFPRSGPDFDEFTGSGALAATDVRGLAWTVFGTATFAESGGSAVCTSGPLSWGGNTDIAWVDEGPADFTVSITFRLATLSRSHGCGVCFRVGAPAAVNGYLALVYRSSSGSPIPSYVQQYVNGTLTTLRSAGANASGTTIQIIVVCAGSSVSITWKQDGTTFDIFSFTDTHFTTNTKVGISIYGGGAGGDAIDRWDFSPSAQQPPLGNFSFTGAMQTWTVPAGITSITATLKGAQGVVSGGHVNSGYGGVMRVTLPVTPGEVLNIQVGGVGSSSGYTPGWPDGGAGGIRFGGSGGGSSAILRGLTLLAVAGGGGGGGGASFGGIFGATIDGGFGGFPVGTAGDIAASGTTGGGGGTQSAGGAAGTGGNPNGTAGSLGQGGSGGTTGDVGIDHAGGGGGGGGYYGGGGGAGNDSGTTLNATAGGGGSSYCIPAGTVVSSSSDNTGNGSITIEA